MTRMIRSTFAPLLFVATMLQAQSTTQMPAAELLVRTFILQNLSPDDAAALVGPYVEFVPGGGVFKANAVRGITVRGNAAAMARVDSLLRASDRPPASVRLRLQVIAALDSAAPADPALSGLEGELRSVLRFNGYRLLAQGVLSTSDNQSSELTLSAGKSEPFVVQTYINRIEPSDKGTVRMNLTLLGWPFTNVPNSRTMGKIILSTGLTIPLGQSVVVGSGSATLFDDKGNRPMQQALLLVVRADPVTGKP